MKRTLTVEQLAARDARRAKFRSVSRQIAAMTPEKRASLAASMPGVITVEGRALSPFNCCLVIMQSGGTATIVGGFRQWIAHGRAVKKGEHGLSIWVPCGARRTETEGLAPDGDTSGERAGFLMGTVFDVSQTAEIAAGENPNAAIELSVEMPKLECAEVAA